MKIKQRRKQFLASLLVLMLICTLFPQNIMAETVYIDRKADVAFVIDATGSMSTYIESVKTNLSEFISQISGADVDVRVRFIIYRDTTCGEETVCSAWYTDALAAEEYLSKVSATGGGDGPETMLDGMGAMLTSGFGFRSDAAKFCIALTDASTKLMNSYGFKTENEVVDSLQARGIITSIITESAYFGSYNKYVTEDAGILADISGDYSIMLKELGDVVISGAEKFAATGITPSYTEEGTSVVVRVYGTELEYADDFAVFLGEKSMKVEAKTESYFDFTVPSSMTVGSYAVNVRNNSVTSKVGMFRVVRKVKPIGGMTMTPNSSKEGVQTTVKVTCPNMSYAKDFAIKLGTTKMTVSYKGDNYFKFYVPSSMKAGTYTVTMTNDGAEETLGEYTVIPNPAPVLTMKLQQTTSTAGTAATVKVTVSGGKLTYKSFMVKLGDTKAVVSYRGDSYFKFCIPTSMTDGTYPVTVIDNGTEYEVENYVLTPKPPAPAPVIKLSQSSSEAGTAVTVKATVSGGKLSYKDFSVKLGSTKMSVAYKGDSYFKFTIPAAMTDGTYPVSVNDNGAEYTVGNYVITPKAPELEPTMTLGQTSSTVGTAATVKVTVTGGKLSYKSDFGVYFGSTKMAVSYKGDSYFKFTVPSSMAKGVYTVSVINGAKTTEIGTYTVKEKVIPVPSFGSMSATSGSRTTKTTVKVTYSNMKYASDFKVEVGGVKAVLAYKGSSYFKFYTPSGMSAGTHDVFVTNAGTTYNIGTFTFY